MPEGKPAVAAQAEFDWPKVLRDVEHVLPANTMNAPRLAAWREFIDARRARAAQLAQCPSLAKWDFKCRPAGPQGPISSSEVAARQVHSSTVRMRQPQSITSSAADGSEGRAARAERRAADAETTFAELEPNTFAMVKATYPNPGDDDYVEGGCRIPWLLVQLPATFRDVNTANGSAKFTVKWWEPKPPNGKYTGKWRKWMNRGRQQTSEIQRDMITVINVQFTRTAELSGGFRNMNAPTIGRIRTEPNSQYAQFS